MNKDELKKELDSSRNEMLELSRKGESILGGEGKTDEEKLRETMELLKKLSDAAKRMVQADKDIKEL